MPGTFAWCQLQNFPDHPAPVSPLRLPLWTMPNATSRHLPPASRPRPNHKAAAMTALMPRPGFVDVFATASEVETMTAETGAPSLSGRALRSLRTFFDAQGHRPSDAHWAALYAVVSTMQAMADGRCPAKIHLSPCDPGVGKSQSVVHFARELVADAAYGDAGMIVSVFTIEEAKAMAKELRDISGNLCVRTSSDEANAMGEGSADAAQILITTQSRLGRLTADRPFGSVSSFFYRGAPRSIRVWDESVLPGSTIVIGADDLMALASGLRRFSPELIAALYAFASQLLAAEDGAAVDVPDFGVEGGTTIDDLVAHLVQTGSHRDGHNKAHGTAMALQAVNGRRVRVRRDGFSGSAVLTFREELPPDLLPMLVLDASGRVRETYALWQASRNAIVQLPSAVRDYAPLTVKVWKTSGSKSGWEKNGARLIDGIVATIETKPEEKWLVVVHKPNGAVGDPEAAIRAKLPPTVRDRVSFTTWGRHTGVNAWADVPNVILAGTLFYPAAHLTATHHLCANLPVEDGLVDRAEVAHTERGEHRHLLLQAICRGRVRHCDGDRCQPMTAYVIASPKSRIAAELPRVFPGCSVASWEPLKVEATGKLREAVRWLTDAVEGGRTELTYAEVYRAIGLTKANFAKRIAKAEAWLATITDLDAEVVRGPRGALLVRLLPSDA